MKRILLKFLIVFEDTPFGILVILWGISLLFIMPLTNLLATFFSVVVVRIIVVTWLFGLMGVMGTMIAYYQEMPVLFFFVKGRWPMLVGIILAIVGFGAVICAWFIHFNELFHP